MGIRARRHSMAVADGVAGALNVEVAGRFEVGDADTMLGKL